MGPNQGTIRSTLDFEGAEGCQGSSEDVGFSKFLVKGLLEF